MRPVPAAPLPALPLPPPVPQSTANQALSTAQSNSTAIEAINEKIDRMFKKSVSK